MSFGDWHVRTFSMVAASVADMSASSFMIDAMGPPKLGCINAMTVPRYHVLVRNRTTVRAACGRGTHGADRYLEELTLYVCS